MTDLTSLDLVERLRERAEKIKNASPRHYHELVEAADTITRLRALTAPGEGCEVTLKERGDLLRQAEYEPGHQVAETAIWLHWREILPRVLRDLTRAEARANEATAALSRERDVVQELGLQLHEARAALAAEKERADAAEALRDAHFAEIKRAQRIIDEMKAWRATIYNQSINADWIATILSEHPEPDSRSYVAVQIAEQCDKAIANARAIADDALAAERAARVKAEDALRSISDNFMTGWATDENHDPLPRHEVIGKVERIARAALSGATP